MGQVGGKCDPTLVWVAQNMSIEALAYVAMIFLLINVFDMPYPYKNLAHLTQRDAFLRMCRRPAAAGSGLRSEYFELRDWAERTVRLAGHCPVWPGILSKSSSSTLLSFNSPLLPCGQVCGIAGGRIWL